MAAVSYGDYWRNLRRISALDIFSSSSLSSSFGIRRDEVKILLRKLHRVSSHCFAKVEIRSMIFDLTGNIILRMVTGKRYYGEDVEETEEAKMFREIMEEVLQSLAVIKVRDFDPVLEWVDFSGYIRKLDELGKKVDRFLQGLLDEHRDGKEINTTMN